MNVDCLIAKSEYLYRRVTEAYPIDPRKVVILNNGVDLGTFHPESHARQKIRDDFSIQGKDLLVGIVGRISPAKGHTEFLTAASKVREVLPQTKFFIVGGSSRDEAWYEREIYTLAQELGLGENTFFTGHREDIPDILSALDLFVMTSYREAFPNVLIEAMAMGKACIATGAGGVLDVITPGIDGFLVPPRDVETLADTILLLLKDPKKREALGRRAREKVEERFDLNEMVERLEEIYLRTLDGEKFSERYVITQ